MNAMQGGDYGDGFLSGAVGSIFCSAAGVGTHNQNQNIKNVSMVAAGSLSAGVTSAMVGDDFWSGFRNGFISSLLNHVMHDAFDEIGEPEGKDQAGGGITFGEADGHHKWRNGEPLYVDLNKIDFGDVTMSRFDNPEFNIEGHPGVYVRFETSDYVNIDQALVYGTIGIVKVGDNTIMAMPDTYDFDLKLKDGTFIRDAATVLGKTYAGYGTPFPIYFRGTTTLP